MAKLVDISDFKEKQLRTDLIQFLIWGEVEYIQSVHFVL